MAEAGEAGLHELVRRFRRAFVLACKPRYLPKAWDVDTVQSREFGEYSVYAKEEEAAAAAAAAVKEAGDGSGMANGSRGAGSGSNSSAEDVEGSSSEEDDDEVVAAEAPAAAAGCEQEQAGAFAGVAGLVAAGGMVLDGSTSIFSRG
jgi:hypothetical protein